MTLEEKIEMGRQAAAFMKYSEENPYFSDMIERMRVHIMARMCGLRSHQVDEFKSLSEKFHFLSEIAQAPLGEAIEGEEAYRIATGEKSITGGIL